MANEQPFVPCYSPLVFHIVWRTYECRIFVHFARQVKVVEMSTTWGKYAKYSTYIVYFWYYSADEINFYLDAICSVGFMKIFPTEICGLVRNLSVSCELSQSRITAGNLWIAASPVNCPGCCTALLIYADSTVLSRVFFSLEETAYNSNRTRLSRSWFSKQSTIHHT